MNPGRGWLRLLRGGVLATASVLLGLSGHLFGGGSADAALAAPTLLVGAVVGAGAVAWAHRRRGFGQLLAAATVAQVALHVTLSLMPAHHDHGAAATSSFGLSMVLGHAAASLVMAWALARGETALWALGRILFRPRRAAVAASAYRPGLVPIPLPGVLVPAGLRVATAHPHRGPPEYAAV